MTQPAVGPFEAGYRIRFDEAGPDGLARASILLRLAHDVAWRHSGHLGFDRAWYLERGLAWLVRTVDLELRQPIPAGAELVVDTEVTAYGRITARRRSAAWLPGEPAPAAIAMTDWVLIDARGRPTRLPSEFTALFGAPTEHADPGRVPIGGPPATANRVELLVRQQDLDPNGHVNNAVYLDWLDEAVRLTRGPDAQVGRVDVPSADVPSFASIPRRYRVEYLGAATVDETLAAAVWPVDRAWSMLISRPAEGREVARGQLIPGKAAATPRPPSAP